MKPGISKFISLKAGIFKSDLVLFLTATIWGLAFVAQRLGMEHIGPFTFNTLRFALGCVSLLPLLWFSQRKRRAAQNPPAMEFRGLVKSGTIAGFFLFCGISLQQIGLVYTTAGKAGFITCLYVVLVPLLGLFLKMEKTSMGTWVGALLALFGMYFLSVSKESGISQGDFMVFLSAICFAFHVIVIDRYSRRFDTAMLSFAQCLVCALLSLFFALALETFVLKDITKVITPLVYGGVMSVGVAYSLQIYGQKHSPPAHAAIIFSLESVVAAIGGWVILNEILSGRAMFGCALMLTGMLVSQLYKP